MVRINSFLEMTKPGGFISFLGEENSFFQALDVKVINLGDWCRQSLNGFIFHFRFNRNIHALF